MSYADKYEYLGLCLFCSQPIFDAKEASGYTGPGPDPATDDGDFGCDDNPFSSEEGCAEHVTAETAIAHYVRYQQLKAKAGNPRLIPSIQKAYDDLMHVESRLP